MSTTVTYKGTTLTTIENTNKVLKTAGKYMEDDVTILDYNIDGNDLAYGISTMPIVNTARVGTTKLTE